MAAAYTCDGCGKALDVPKEIGLVVRRDYCEDCAAKAQAFLDAEEALRQRLYDQFTTDRGLLIASASDGGFKLPDVPDGA